MSLVEGLRRDALQARKDARGEGEAAAKAGVVAKVLSTVVGEIEGASKRPGFVEDDVLKVVAKFVKNADETFAALAGRNDAQAEEARAAIAVEKEALLRYLPTKMTDDEIAAFVRARIAEGVVGMGPVMAALKAAKAGAYDGAAASRIVKAELGSA